MKLGNRYSQHSFAAVPQANMARSRFNRSYSIKTTFDFDYLVPIMVEEILPGDTINLNVNSFARLATQLVPILDNMYVDFYFFFVPNRLVWTNFQKFMGEQDNPADSTDYVVPTVTSANTTDFAVGTIYDQMGIPTGLANIEVNALPLRAYNLIWNQWFRSEDLQNSVTVDKDDGPDTVANYTLLKGNKRHDYFTSCLPWPQKGDAVQLALGTVAPIRGTNVDVYGHTEAETTDQVLGGAASDDRMYFKGTGLASNSDLRWSTDSSKTGLETDLSSATAATINELRQAFLMQSILELDARGGTRYTEILRAHFGVISPDARLQRPEFLSAGTININQHPVAQTAPTSGTNYLAQLASFSTAQSYGNKIGFSKSFVEHGYVLGLIKARSEITYQQGLNKMWSRSTKYDFYWPKFAQLGEQAVLNGELYAQGTSADLDVFGYQERYAEYRYSPSQIRGQFRSTFATPLDVWHQAEEFGSLPTLNSSFLQLNSPIERALAVAGTYPHMLLDCWFDLKHSRPIPVYGIPATLGRF